MLRFFQTNKSLFGVFPQADGGLRVHPAGKSEPARRDAQLVSEDESGREGRRADGGKWRQRGSGQR